MNDDTGLMRRGFAIIMLLSSAIIRIALLLARYQSDSKIHEKSVRHMEAFGPSRALYYGGIENQMGTAHETRKGGQGQGRLFSRLSIPQGGTMMT